MATVVAGDHDGEDGAGHGSLDDEDALQFPLQR